MQHRRVIALDEWFPARRRRLSRQNEPDRHDASCAERRRLERGAGLDPPKLARRSDQDGEPPMRMNAA